MKKLILSLLIGGIVTAGVFAAPSTPSTPSTGSGQAGSGQGDNPPAGDGSGDEG